jgi:hypothetical protein
MFLLPFCGFSQNLTKLSYGRSQLRRLYYKIGQESRKILKKEKKKKCDLRWTRVGKKEKKAISWRK